jgi:hypothetical protein
VLLKKNFTFEPAHLFISLWSLSDKNLLFRTKLDLCTAVDSFSCHRDRFRPRKFDPRVAFRNDYEIATRLFSRCRKMIVWWCCGENRWRF